MSAIAALSYAIDRDRSGFLSTQELATDLHQAGKVLSEGELTYLFNCMDREEMAVVRSTLRNLAN
jgi:Ca2+-binding EF-hand superfamily protein